MEHFNATNVMYLSAAISSSVLLYNKVLKKSQPAPFPPGPKPLPIVGNIKDMPTSKTYKTFREWAKVYGDIVHVDVLGVHIIILNSPEYVDEMLETKSRIYSERPILTMIGTLADLAGSTALRQTDSIWVEHRRHMANFMGTRSKVETFESAIHDGIMKMLPRLRANPRENAEIFQLFTGSLLLMLVYGYEVKDEEDYFVKVFNSVNDGFGEMTQSGAFLVDFFPMLRHIPGWLPGTGWKAIAMKYRDEGENMLTRPYNWTKEQMKSGTARPCFITDILENGEYTPEQERSVLAWAAVGVTSGGTHTTSAALCCFILGIIRHTPELRKAQEEINTVIGNDRLPTLADRPRLPYFEALCMEIHRLYTIAPLGLQHVAREDDIHNDYFIPKGTMVIANDIMIYRNERLYPNPEKFMPERFLELDAAGKRKQRDPRDFAFGFGRRRCPGVQLANAILWLTCATLITVYDFEPVVIGGKPAIPPGKFWGEFITHPEPFDYVITPRSKFFESLLQSL